VGWLRKAWGAASRRQKIVIVIAALVGLGAIGNAGRAPGTGPSAGANAAPTASLALGSVIALGPTATPTDTAATPTETRGPTAGPAAEPTTAATPKPTPRPTATPKPRPTATPAPTGVYGNPWGYSFRTGNLIYNPPAAFCNYFPCIASFWTSTAGYVVECVDLTFSHSGGRTGVCSKHGGYYRTLYSH
jgi:hypothetical protein